MSTAPISLYFGVDKGKNADLETIAYASLEWAGLIRDIAAIVAPDIEFEIEFVESEEGSIWLSNLLRAVKGGDRKALMAIVGAVLTFFAMGPVLHLQADFGDWLLEKFGHEDEVNLTESDKRDLVERVKQAVRETQIEERRRNIIAIAERDNAVKSVGVDLLPSADGPITKISRDQFPRYDAIAPTKLLKEAKDENVIYERNIDVNVIRAALRAGDRKPRWRFRHGDDEWSATIEDEEFVWALNQDRTGLHLAVGQHMRVDVAIDLRQIDGEWEPHNRRIVRVRAPHVNRSQGDLGFGRE